MIFFINKIYFIYAYIIYATYMLLFLMWDEKNSLFLTMYRFIIHNSTPKHSNVTRCFLFRNPLVSFSMLQKRMADRRMIKMSFIQNYIKGGDIEGDWVTMGVIVSKVPPKKSVHVSYYFFYFCSLSLIHLCYFKLCVYVGFTEYLLVPPV